MARHGLAAGDVVGLSLGDELAAIVAMLATARIGATVFWIPRGAAPVLRDAMLAEVSARALVTDSPDGAQAPVPAITVDLADLARSREPVDAGLRAARPTAAWMIITGSGSTGRPKKIPITHGQFIGQMRAYREALGLHTADRVASTMSIDAVVTRERYLDAVLAGASVVLGGARGGDLPDWLARTGTTILWSTVVHAESILAAGRRLGLGRAPASLRAFIVGSSTVGASLRARLLAEFTDRLHVYYGTNEVGLATMAGPEELRADPLTVGRAAPGVDVEVVDPDGRRVREGEVGLVRIRAPGMAARYLDDPEATSAAFRDGWFHPKDLGRLGAGGLLDHCGRADDLMIVNGINVYPAEVERALASVPGVAQAVAVPVRHPVHQDIPVGVVTLETGSGLDEPTLLGRARTAGPEGAGARRRAAGDPTQRPGQAPAVATVGDRRAARARERGAARRNLRRGTRPRRDRRRTGSRRGVSGWSASCRRARSSWAASASARRSRSWPRPWRRRPRGRARSCGPPRRSSARCAARAHRPSSRSRA